MGVFSFLNKNKTDGASVNPAARSDDSDALAGRSRARERKAKGASAVPDDPLLPEKKRARRRLLGAIALVIAVVIGLPMALDPEPKPLADDIAIQIPARDKPAPVYASTVAPAPNIAASLDQKEEIFVPEKSAPSAESTSTASPSRAAANKLDVEPNEPAPTPIRPVAKASVTPPRSPAPDIDDSARGKAILEGKLDTRASTEMPTDEVKAESGTGKVVLQVAALATQEKITEVQNKLKSVGINSYTQKISTESGPRTRIRIIAANAEEVARLRVKLAKVSLSASAVAPNP